MTPTTEPATGRLRRAGWLTLALALIAAACTSDSDDGVDGGAVEEPAAPTLTVRSATIEVGGTAVDESAAVTVDPGDRVVSVDGGRGVLDVPGLLDTEIFLASDFVVPDAPTADGDPVDLELSSGHLLVRADPGVQVDLVTGNRTLRAIVPGTHFVVCQSSDGDTCLFVIDGEVEWSDEYGVARYRSGEGTFARADQGPQAARCDQVRILADWEERARSGDADQTLPQIVAALDEGPCATGADADTSVPPTSSQAASTSSSPPPGGTSLPDGPLPPGNGMVYVEVDEPTIGTTASSAREGAYIAPRTLVGPMRYFVDATTVTNDHFRTWLGTTFGGDAARWKELVPARWLDGVPDGLEFLADWPEDESGDEPVTGIRWTTATQFCEGIGKRMVTEVEWEVAATTGHLADLRGDHQDWVADPGGYGPGVPADERVKRGTDDTLRPDLHYRVVVPDTPESTATRLGTRIRCSADDVQDAERVKAATQPEVIDDDEFTGAENWPTVAEETFTQAYHPPDVYHLEALRPGVRGAVWRSIDTGPVDDLTIATEMWLERRLTSPDDGALRFGVIVGDPLIGFTSFTVAPDETGAGGHRWCVGPLDDELVSVLADERWASLEDPGRDGAAACGDDASSGAVPGELAVDDPDEPFTLTIRTSADGTSYSIDDDEVHTADRLGPIAAYGFVLQTDDKQAAHVHYDALRVTSP